MVVVFVLKTPITNTPSKHSFYRLGPLYPHRPGLNIHYMLFYLIISVIYVKFIVLAEYFEIPPISIVITTMQLQYC